MKYLLIIILSFSYSIYSCSKFLPENNMLIPAYMKTDSPVTKASFFKILDEVEDIYSSVIEQRGSELEMIKDWDTPWVNANSYKCLPGVAPIIKGIPLTDCTKEGNKVVYMFGGLARHPKMTEDAFTLIACHEIGHHLGGAPKKTVKWSSNEGQADYWATLKCARAVWQNQDNFSVIQEIKVNKLVEKQCEQSHGSGHDYALCIRSSMAAKSIAQVIAQIKGLSEIPAFETASKIELDSTNHHYSKAQCRLDTYFMGALCDVSHTIEVSQEDPTIGVCSSTKSIGARPRCWYKP